MTRCVDPQSPPSAQGSEATGRLCFGPVQWPLPDGEGSPEESQGQAVLLLANRGCLEGQVGDQSLGAAGPVVALYLPDQAQADTLVQSFAGLVLRLESQRLERAGVVVSRQGWSPRQLTSLLQQPVAVPAANTVAQRHLQRLEALARLLDPREGHPQEEIELLGLDDLLDRLVVLALWGDRLLSSPEGNSPGNEREAILDELVQWIRANSHRPLHLADLERQSGYSDRSLRNAFQERYGCPPKQWIRRTRMEAARERLLNPEPGDSVSSIARDYGYQHVSQFSRDFRCVFGQRPSLVMRKARRSLL